MIKSAWKQAYDTWRAQGIALAMVLWSGLAAAQVNPIPNASLPPFDPHILVDQFGYRPADPKVAVIRTPHRGFDAADRFVPGGAGYEVRSASDHRVVLAGTLRPWRDGAVQSSSGDSGWWFDFSTVREPGRYYVLDRERRLRSAVFRIDRAVYVPLLRTALRVFFYQRSGCAKSRPFADACWTDPPAYVGKLQDREARDIRRPKDRASARDLSGGWFDAGDTNKYVTFSSGAVHSLLEAYRRAPGAFTDDIGIPESGNGIPDLLDEVLWQLNWLKKMQNRDGSSLLKVGVTRHVPASPPSSDREPRYYVGPCTSATIASAAMFAHAAYVLDQVSGLKGHVRDLRRRAARGFDAFTESPLRETDCDERKVLSGDADLDAPSQDALAVVAAIYLFATTDEPRFDVHVKANYRRMRPFHDFGWSRYDAHLGDALLFYTTLPKADPEVRRAILDAKLADAAAGEHHVYGLDDEDLYRNHLHDDQYHWGSNVIRLNYANSNLDMPATGLMPERAPAFRARALESLHYLHGVNPLGMVYMTNMYPLGATRSANEAFSQWFAPGSRWSNALTSACGPVPGYVTGGPNASAAQDGVPPHLEPPVGQPPQKSYRDWNAHGLEASYAITEPSITIQATYVKALSAFVE